MFIAWAALLVVSGAVEGARLCTVRLARAGKRMAGCIGELAEAKVDRWYVHYAHVRSYCSLSPNEFSAKSL
jgi:hypothetical protein